jgi:uracil-DNA glycosylase
LKLNRRFRRIIIKSLFYQRSIALNGQNPMSAYNEDEYEYEIWYPGILVDIREEWQPFFRENKHFLRSADTALRMRDKPITPRGLEIFNAYQLTPPNLVKVILVGQDPYYQLLSSGETKATGCSFSLRPYDEPTKSLKTIFQELESDIPGFVRPDHGNLESWAEQGVFLLNSSLTTDIGEANQHQVQWKEFIAATIRYLEELNPDLCYIMWGAEARKLNTGSKFKKFCAAHPASRGNQFLGCRHFSSVNKHLVERGIDPIDWTSICDKTKPLPNEGEAKVKKSKPKSKKLPEIRMPPMKLKPKRN